MGDGYKVLIAKYVFIFSVPWLNAMLTALSTSSVYIETLNNDHWHLPTGRWFVDRDWTPICSYSNSTILKGCLDRNAGGGNFYWVGNGNQARGDRITTLSQNRECLYFFKGLLKGSDRWELYWLTVKGLCISKNRPHSWLSVRLHNPLMQ